jgi:3-oxoadipate enol-lactonase
MESTVKRLTLVLALSVAVVAAIAVSSDARAQTGFLIVEGGDSLYYEAVGSGSVVVLLHDGTFHSIVWDHQVPALSQQYKVIRYDRRGYGRSNRPDASYSNARDLSAVLDHLGVEKAVLVGSSAGGQLAAEYALTNRERVAGLVLIGALVSGLPHAQEFVDQAWSRVDPLLNSDRTAVLDPIPLSVQAEVVRRYAEDPYFISIGNSAAKIWVQLTLSAHFENVLNPTRWIKWLDPPLRDRLSEIRVPTLILVGEEDHPELHAHAGAFQLGLTGARRVLIANAAHLPQVERPSEVNKLILEFLQEVVDPKVW